MKQILIFLALCLSFSLSAEEARLLRFPAVGGGKVVFCYAGNLYSVDINGGNAVKLTSDVGYECFPKVSPDGQTIAFTAQYDGNTEVYTIPISGGEPKRLTYTALVSRDQVGERMGPNNIVMAWTPDGKQIVYRSKQHNFSGLRGRLCKVSVEGGTPEIIPTTEGGFCSYSPDGSQLAMNRMFREFRTWKYYRGGQADDIWINEVGTTKLTKICDNDAQDIFPMWLGNEIYYLSDRDRIMNLFVYNTDTKQTRKVTNFTDYDCKFPAAWGNYIVFENGGYIYKYDTTKGKAEKLNITLNDDNVYGRNEYRKLSSDYSSFSLSPDGKRVLLIARGDIYSLPAENGPVRNISNSPISHEREVRWSPDGEKIAWISDLSGEYQVYIAPASDISKAKQITSFTSGYPTNLQWNSDGSKLYFSGLEGEIYEIEDNRCTKILESSIDGISSFKLSYDGTWAAYTENLDNYISALYLFDIAARKSYQITDRWYNASQPLFSKDGKYLFFNSAELINSNYAGVEWNIVSSMSNVSYIVSLAADTANPLTLNSDEYAPEQPKTEVKESTKKKKESVEAKAKMKVDIEGIQQRITKLPMNGARFYLADNDKLYYSGGGRSNAGKLNALDLKTMKISDGPAYPVAITADAKYALVKVDGDYKVTGFTSPAGKSVGSVPVDEIDMIINHKAEWKQIFDESWRVTRDNFYVKNMHGADWDKVYDKYAQMLPYVNHRDDLTYLIGEMIGELNCGHAYITSGDKPSISRIPTGLLGAKYSKDAQTGAFRIDEIFEGASWSSSLVSPLEAPGVEAKVGEYIVEVNEIPSSSLLDVNQALIGKVDKTVSIKLASDAKGTNARKVYVKPISDESQLAYYQWVKGNIEKVDKLSGGQIGYIHIPDMSLEGWEMFVRLYYNQLDKKALIIDDRMNGGGNVSPIILERLQREVYRMNMYSNFNINLTVPNEAFYGPMVCLIDKYSSSDGDLFPYGFRKLGLGKIIGKRSWGGIVGISGSRQFVDGQDMRTPFFTSYSTDGEWIIEGHGVDPDIDVDINPFEDYLGKDAQIERAVEELLKEIPNWKPLPSTPVNPPVKN